MYLRRAELVALSLFPCENMISIRGRKQEVSPEIIHTNYFRVLAGF